LAVRQYTNAIRAAAEIGAPAAVVVSGRQHPLRPIPDAIAMAGFTDALSPLLHEADKLGIVLALETVPFGFLETARKLSYAIDAIGHPSLRIALDAANMLMVEDPAEGVFDAGERIQICHVSDAWKAKWAHTSIGRGEVEFGKFRRALESVGYDGVTIYELMDDEDPAPRLRGDLEKLRSMGWEYGSVAGSA
jgi:sugar phosphate isomerase/epimerase